MNTTDGRARSRPRVAIIAEGAMKHLPGLDDWAYALHAAPCSLAVLWLAMWLEFDAPYWAGSTVMITSQASRAQGLLKGLNRVIGTMVRTVAGVVLGVTAFTLTVLLLFPSNDARSLRASLTGWLDDGATEAPWIRPRKPLLRGAVLGLVDCIMASALGREQPEDAAAVERLRSRTTPRLPRDAAGRPLWSVPLEAGAALRGA